MFLLNLEHIFGSSLSDFVFKSFWPAVKQLKIMLRFIILQDIQLSGLGILHEHCQLDIEDNEVYVTPLAKTGYVYKRKKNLAGLLIILVWIEGHLFIYIYMPTVDIIFILFYSFHQHCM